MELAFFTLIIGFILGICLFLLLKKIRKPWKNKDIGIYSTIEKFRSVGELVVFKIVTKEIITASDHWFGNIGKKYFQWLASNKKMVMIFQFGIDFKYNLHNPDFTVETMGNGNFRLRMPKCEYESHINDISFYDEQGAKLLPWLLPHLLTKALSDGMNEETKNRLISEAKNQASQMAHELVQKIQSEVQKSAAHTLEILARGFGANKIVVDFSDSGVLQTNVDYQDIKEISVNNK
jgi:hypothetical protein